jgi:RHS repeat-associated protein
LGGQLLAIQSNNAVTWVHQEPFSKGQRLTDAGGNIVSTVELDPWGGETSRSSNTLMQPHKYTSYERDSDGNDYAMNRRYGSSGSRFLQPDPYDGSYNLTNPQSFNRYSYTQNDPVNFVDPTGLMCFMMTTWGNGEGQFGQQCVWFGDYEPFGTFQPKDTEPAATDVGKEPQNSDPSKSDELTPEQAAQFTNCLSEMFKVYNDGYKYQREGEAWFHGHSDSRRHFWNSPIGDFTVRTDQQTKSSTQLGNMADPVGVGRAGGNSVVGYTDKRNPYFNYIANDARPAGVSGRENLGLWVFELGNALSVITNRMPDIPADSRNRYGVVGEAGAAFEDCVFGGKLNSNGSVTGPK